MIRKSSVFIFLGIIFLGFGGYMFFVTFWPIAKLEVKYNIKADTFIKESGEMQQIDTEFGIVIPKINANASIVANVDPYDSKKYQMALTRGVAHAAGSSLPGQSGNIFIFSHSSSDFLSAVQYNSVFYLLSKLENGDDVYIYYKGVKYHYKIVSKEKVSAEDTKYLKAGYEDKQTLTLMTCWPPGTSFKRLLLRADFVN